MVEKLSQHYCFEKTMSKVKRVDFIHSFVVELGHDLHINQWKQFPSRPHLFVLQCHC